MGLGGGPASRLQGRTEAPAIQVPALRRAPASRKMPAGPSLNNPVPPQRSAYSLGSGPAGTTASRSFLRWGASASRTLWTNHLALHGTATATVRKGTGGWPAAQSPHRKGNVMRIRGGSGRPFAPGGPPRVPRLNPKAPQVPFGPPQTVLRVKSTHVHLPSCPQIGDHGSAHSL